MKRTVTVSLNGNAFELEDDAFKLLDSYLNQLDSYFSKEEGKSEIIADIEARIAEHFAEYTVTSKQVINVEMVKKVIEIMGTPGNIDGTESENPHTGKTYRKLYRDIDDRVLGGVCSGMGYYWNVDPLIFRIIFILLAIWVGSGILVYLILWIVVPPAITSVQKLEMKGEDITAEKIGKEFESKNK
ncbi:MAG: PspC domain-containing protein [Bacteroidales bacterium]|nr:PspC domain-containing protein [Bacteroidales bacterium]HPD95754.1 PspC domain-containing protein [Tenuifilaceae bacterium]HRX32231.1 PspC domain-containing protein [Tenuifilaceae bacterium]